MTKLTTLYDVRSERRRPSAAALREAARQARFTPPADLHPAIGTLVTPKGLRFYAYFGTDRVYREGTAEALTTLLTSEAGR